MEKNRVIPQGYMTVGEAAKKVGVTVRTLQHYDKVGVLSPSSKSKGDRRLYTYKDIAKLYQILSMKYLGFSLEEIKNRLPQINTPQEVSAALMEQAKIVENSIKSLQDVLNSIEILDAEVVQMESVDWKKYAEIVGLLHLKNPSYWLVKHIDSSLLERIQEHVKTKLSFEAATQLSDKHVQIIEAMAKTQKDGHPPNSAEAVALAKEWWDYATEFAGGDFTILSKLIEMGNQLDNKNWSQGFSFDKDYLEKALAAYFKSIGYDPLGEE